MLLFEKDWWIVWKGLLICLVLYVTAADYSQAAAVIASSLASCDGVVVKSRNGFSPTKKHCANCAQTVGFCFSSLDRMKGINATTEQIDLASMTSVLR